MSGQHRLGIPALCVVCIFGAACGGGSSRKSSPSPSASGPNVQAIGVNAGPTGNYANGLFTSVTVCSPGTSTCQTINNVLVDTGSFGLRLVSSVLTISLPQENAANGSALAECLPFMTGTTWGPVKTADIKISGETASALPVQVLSDTAFPEPTACKNFGMQPQDTVNALGANGILGIGLGIQDCVQCVSSTSPNLYYACASSSCQATTASLSQQVQNPVAAFAKDNNGVIITLPAVSAPEASVNGTLIFGIGTESNNALGSATVYTTDNSGNFTTTYKGQAYSSSFIDSGSNAIFFLDSATTGMPQCPGSENGFYCPTATQSFSATNKGQNGASGTVNFSVANADSLFAVSGDAVFNTLGGPSPGLFDWGLPFFYGRAVYVAIVGSNTPGGAGPYWAY